MDIFESRWASLIKTYENRPSVEPLNKVMLISLVAVDRKGRVVWESSPRDFSRVDEILLDSVPRFTFSVEWSFYVTGFSLDGNQTFVDKWILQGIEREPDIGQLGRVISSSRVSLRHAFLHVGKEVVPLLDNHRHVSASLLHVLRLRFHRKRKDSEWIWRKRQYIRPNLPGADGSLLVNYQNNFVRSVDGVTTIDTIGVTPVTTFSRSSVRQATPSFHNFRKWELPVNPYTMQEVRLSTRMGYQRVVSTDQPVVTALSYVGPTPYFYPEPAPDLSFGSEARNKAFKRLLGNIDNELRRENFLLTANIVQFRLITTMVARNCNKILRSYKAVKRGDFVTASSALFGTRPPKYRKNGGPSASKSIAMNWLELQYGWKPLLSDIKLAVDAVHRQFHDAPRKVRGVGSVHVATDISILGPFNVSLGSVQPYPAGRRVTNKTVRCEIGVEFRMSDPDRALLAQTGFLSPVSLAWELLPFSFVVDWFAPIGPYLEGLTAFEGLSFVKGYESQFVRETSGVLISQSGLHGVSPQRVIIDNRGGSQRVAVRLERIRLTSFPSRPSITLKNPISVVHATNALALMVAIFKRN